jgi:hypothetical protein
MYARFLTARHNRTAAGPARDKAAFLKEQGDSEGHRIWNEVADVAETHQILKSVKNSHSGVT